MRSCDCGAPRLEATEQGRVLIILLALNAGMFVLELVAGILAESSGLIADSLDMAADAAVYGGGLYAVGRSLTVKVRTAFASGYLEIGLAAAVAVDIARRAIFGSAPEPVFMIAVSVLALSVNVACLVLLAKHRRGEIHMRASWIFSRNDVIANAGVILGGSMVYGFGARWPDLVVGIVIAAIVFRGGLAIVVDARQEYRAVQ